VTPQHKEELNRQLDLLLEADIIRKSYIRARQVSVTDSCGFDSKDLGGKTF
jgi:hypothetical protein